MLIYHFFRLPEPSGRSFAEMDLLFERRTPARKFKTANINALDTALRHQIAEDKPSVAHLD